jgi:hypothetical protein
MFKIGLAALIAAPLAFTSAKALDNAAAANTAAVFSQFGVTGLAVAGAAHRYAPFGPPAYSPVCWTQYVRVGNAYSWVDWPYTICR